MPTATWITPTWPASSSPPKVFSDWLKLITATKAGWSYSDYRRSPGCTAPRCCVRTGTTTVADIEAVPQLLPEVWGATPLRVFSFLEMIGIKPDRQPQPRLAGSRGPHRQLSRRPRVPRRALAPCALLHRAGTAAPERPTPRAGATGA